MDHSDNDCICITVMTHGKEESISSFDKDYPLSQLTEFFTDENCPTLKGKPRMFFIQACRGSKFGDGYMMKSLQNKPSSAQRSRGNDQIDPATPFNERNAAEFVHCAPIYSDYILVRSALPGFVSFRDPKRGSWFIQHLCEKLEKRGAGYEIMDLLTAVNDDVSKLESVPTRKKQTLCISSMLKKVLAFEFSN